MFVPLIHLVYHNIYAMLIVPSRTTQPPLQRFKDFVHNCQPILLYSVLVLFSCKRTYIQRHLVNYIDATYLFQTSHHCGRKNFE